MEHQSPEQFEPLWRRKVPAAEMARLASQPELEREARLTEALGQIPNVPVPSNFTARVMGALELEESRSARAEETKVRRWSWHFVLPRIAVAMAVLLVAGVGYRQHEASIRRAEMAKSLRLVASAAAVPSVDALENLEAIQRMSQPVHADTELLADMQ